MKCFYKINLNVANHVIINNRKISVTNSFLNFLTFAAFVIILALVGQEMPKYLENKKIISAYTQIVRSHDALYAEIASLNAQKKNLEKKNNLLTKFLIEKRSI